MEKRYSAEDAELLRTMVIPQEDLPPSARTKYGGGLRWFRSKNVLCIEHYRRPITTTHTPGNKPAA